MYNFNTLKINNVFKKYGFNCILNDVSIEFRRGEIHSILGENGCGKSTLIKIISDTENCNSGEMFLDDTRVDHLKLSKIKGLKVETVYQNVNLFDTLTVEENIFIKDLPTANTNLGFLSYKALHVAYQKYSSQLNLNISGSSYVCELTIAQKRLIEITRALVSDPDILILDEPMESFSDADAKRLITLLNDLKNQGKMIIIVTHKIEHALKISDRITVLFNGSVAETITSLKTNETDLLKMISGTEIKNRYPKIYMKKGNPNLRFETIYGGILEDISFSLHQGEILGITGVVGCGKTTIGKILMGLEKNLDGSIFISNLELKKRTPSELLKRGIGYIAEDGLSNLIPTFSSAKNITLSNLNKISKFGFLKLKQEKSVRDYFYKTLSITDKHKNFSVDALSGGTQQKICISKVLYSRTKIMVLDEPTVGLDAVSKSDVYNFMVEFVSKGNSILLLSSDFAEIAGMSDRVIILREGKIVNIFNHTELSKEKIIRCSTMN